MRKNQNFVPHIAPKTPKKFCFRRSSHSRIRYSFPELLFQLFIRKNSFLFRATFHSNFLLFVHICTCKLTRKFRAVSYRAHSLTNPRIYTKWPVSTTYSAAADFSSNFFCCRSRRKFFDIVYFYVCFSLAYNNCPFGNLCRRYCKKRLIRIVLCNVGKMAYLNPRRCPKCFLKF